MRVNGHRFTIDPAADLIFLPRPPVKVSQERLFSHYYNNVAVDRLQEGRLDAALQNMAVASTLDPSYATLWSNVGVMHLHDGDAAAAERAYLQALALDPSDASALFNMVQLLHRLNDPRERGYRQRLARVEQKDPLQQFLQALDHERAGNYPRAIASMRRAIQLKPDEHRFYAALARIYEREGDVSRARSALASAQSHSRGKVQATTRRNASGCASNRRPRIEPVRRKQRIGRRPQPTPVDRHAGGGVADPLDAHIHLPGALRAVPVQAAFNRGR